MNKTIQDLEIKRNVELNQYTNLLVFNAPDLKEDLLPGQFANVHVKDSTTTFLRRPFSIYDFDKKEGTFSLIIKKVGDGTKKLAEFKEGDCLSVIYPLGKPFSYPNRGEKVLLIGGGSGIAPMMILAKSIAHLTDEIHILLGARSSKDHIELDKFEKVGKLHLTTEDGSLGEKGFVTNHSVFDDLKQFDRVYTCGPNPMMKAIGDIAIANNVDCEVSLENMMGCGFGVCLCCVTPTHEKGNVCVCSDGPVFKAEEVKW